MSGEYEKLRETLGEVSDLEESARVLYWDLSVNLPPGGYEGRGRVLATLERRSHDLFTSDDLGRRLEAAEAEVASLDPDSVVARVVAVTRRDHDRERRVPSELIGEMAEATAAAEQVWQEARATSDFKLFAPHLDRNVELSRRRAEAIGFDSRPYDALLFSEPGMTIFQLEALFAQLKEAIVPLVRQIREHSDAVDDSCLYRDYPTDRQLELVTRIIRRLGFDFERGRIDASAHPFMIHINPGDVRLTNRVSEGFLPMSIFGGIHESGHGMYGQGVSPELAQTPLWDGCSNGFHESQSRLYENLLGRSRPFLRYWFREFQAAFPEALGGIDLETFYRAINAVHPSLIRVEADEVTYNLHILLRVELENDLLEGRLRVGEVPDAWNAKMEEYLGVEPPDHAQGALQDIHWTFTGGMGVFPSYTLGNVISAQLMDKLREVVPDLDAQVEAGEFGPLLGWLRENVHRHGRMFTPAELLRRTTGHELDAGPWIAHVRAKYGEIYGLN